MDAHMRDARLLQWADRFSADGDYFVSLDGQRAEEAVSALQLSLGDLAGLKQHGIPFTAQLFLLRSAQAV
nr:hypothetical protein [uncultured Devosia sp.]